MKNAKNSTGIGFILLDSTASMLGRLSMSIHIFGKSWKTNSPANTQNNALWLGKYYSHEGVFTITLHSQVKQFYLPNLI